MKLRHHLQIIMALALIAGAALTGCHKPDEEAEGTTGTRVVKASGSETTEVPLADDGRRVLSVYVPCGLTLPLKAAINKFEEDYPEIDINDHFDSGVVLVRDVVDKGDRPDVFVSPGPTELGAVEAEGLIDDSTKRGFGSFDLVVIVPKANPSGLATFEDLSKAKTIACPDPEFNSVGSAAKQSLTALGMWDELEPKILPVEIGHESHQHVASGKADAGFAYRSCPLDSAPEKLSHSTVTIVGEFPPDSYDIPQCMVAMLNEARNKDDAKTFIDFLLAPEIQALLRDQHLPGIPEGIEAAGADEAASAAADPNVDALVEIVAYFPGNEDHDYIRDLLTEIETESGGLVRGRFVDFTSDEGYDEWSGRGLSCGMIFVNDKSTFELERDGETVVVELRQGAGHGFWAVEDLREIVDLEVAAARKGAPTDESAADESEEGSKAATDES